VRLILSPSLDTRSADKQENEDPAPHKADLPGQVTWVGISKLRQARWGDLGGHLETATCPVGSPGRASRGRRNARPGPLTAHVVVARRLLG